MEWDVLGQLTRHDTLVLSPECDKTFHLWACILAPLQDGPHELASLAEADSVISSCKLWLLPNLATNKLNLFTHISNVCRSEVLLRRVPYLDCIHVDPHVVFHPALHNFYASCRVSHTCAQGQKALSSCTVILCKTISYWPSIAIRVH